MPTFSSLAESEVANNDEKVGIMTTPGEKRHHENSFGEL